jgi:hypothetical protein
VLAGAERQAAQHGDLASAEAAQRAERTTCLRAVQLEGVADDRALALEAVLVQAGAGPDDVGGRATGQPRGQAGRRRRVADAHLAAGQDGDAVGGGLRGERPPGVDGGSDLADRQGGLSGQVAARPQPLDGDVGGRVRAARDARVDEQDLGAGLAGQRADRAATRANVASICAVTAGG